MQNNSMVIRMAIVLTAGCHGCGSNAGSAEDTANLTPDMPNTVDRLCPVQKNPWSPCGVLPVLDDADHDGILNTDDEYPLCHSSMPELSPRLAAQIILMDICLDRDNTPARERTGEWFIGRAEELGIFLQKDEPRQEHRLTRGDALVFAWRALRVAGMRFTDEPAPASPWSDLDTAGEETRTAALHLFRAGCLAPCAGQERLRPNARADGFFLRDALHSNSQMPPAGAAAADWRGSPDCFPRLGVCCGD